MRKKIQKCFIIFIYMLLCITLLMSFCEVSATDSFSTAMQQALNNTDTANETGASKAANNIVGTIIATTRIIGICVAITMLLVVAMKYMSAAPGEKAEIKKSAIVYVVGAIILFAVVGILGIIESFSTVIK